VRVLSIGDFSMELCGGTHVERTGDIGLFKIISESGVAAGVRRIEAVTGQAAYEWVVHTEQVLRDIASCCAAAARTWTRRSANSSSARAAGKGGAAAQVQTGERPGRRFDAQAKDVGGIKVLAAQIEGADAKSLRDAVDQLKQKLGSSVVVLATVQDGKVVLVAGVSADLLDSDEGGRHRGAVAAQVGGKGGGRADFAQAGGTQPENLGRRWRRGVPGPEPAV
jgi:alanyl-tRNA synthetase